MRKVLGCLPILCLVAAVVLFIFAGVAAANLSREETGLLACAGSIALLASVMASRELPK